MKRSFCFAGAVLALFASLVLCETAWAATRPQTHTHPLMPTRPSTLLPLQVGRAPQKTPTTSANWSGYDVASAGPFSSVSATWTEPRVRPSGAFTDAAFWVGLDGDGSNTVEQIGSESYSQGGTVAYDAWYEMYPAPAVSVPLTIRPGDVLTGTVDESSPGSFTLTLTDQTTGKSFSVPTTSDATAPVSAEVIVEAPTDQAGNVVPLANFGIVSFSACAFDGNPIGTYNWNQIDMTSASGALLDRTSALGADGASFSVTSDLTPPTTTVMGADDRWHSRPVTLHFKATDNPGGTGVAYTEYSLNDGAMWTKGNAVTVQAPADHSNDGIHKVVYRSVDNAGNLEARRICLVRIDTRKPTPIANWRASAMRGETARLLYYVSVPRPGPATATVTIRIRTRAGRLARRLVEPSVPVNRRVAADFLCRLPRDNYRFFVYATDAAGNSQSRVAANELVVH